MNIYVEVNSVFRMRMRTAQTMDLSGTGHWHSLNEALCPPDEEFNTDYECMGYDPLDILEDQLKDALAEITQLRNHKHEWNENMFCWCGWDGNA